MIYNDVQAYIRDHEREMVALLERLVCIETPSVVPESQSELLDVIIDIMDEAGYKTVKIPGGRLSGGHLYVRPYSRNSPSCQLMTGHCDTVWPVGTLKTMPLQVGDNTVRGPGVYDMKGGIVQAVFALRTLKELDITPDLTPLFFINSDEEIGSPESSIYLVRLARCSSRAFVLEPALGLKGKLKTARKGAGRFIVSVQGQSAHAGLDPDAGASAILELSHVIQKLYALNDTDRGISINVGKIEGGIRPNVVAPVARAVVDVRVQSRDDALAVQSDIYAITSETPDTSVQTEGRMGRLPMEPTPRNQALWKSVHRVGKSIGLFLEEGTAGGVSDGNTLSQYTATLDGLGAVGDGAHASHEFLFIDKMVERTILLVLALLLPQEASLPKSGNLFSIPTT